MSVLTTAYVALADLNLWVKSGLNEELSLADVPSIIPSRFYYIVENWSVFKNKLLNISENYSNPSRLRDEMDSFVEIVNIYKTDTTKRIPNISNLMSNYFTVFDSILINDIPTSLIEQKQIDAEIKRVTSFNKNDFIAIRKRLQDGRDAVADSIGASDKDYNRIYTRSSLPTLLSRSIPQIQVSLAFHQGAQIVDDILANQNILKTEAFIDPFAFARSNANNPDIDIRSYSSGRLVKLNYGETLQTLAYRTMGDQNRWIEIAISNGLKPPYIDETGEKVPLLVNAKNNIINLSKTDTNGNANKEKIYVNQIVILQSNIERTPDQRVVVSIKEVPVSGELIIELSGKSDLEKYKITDQAHVRVFKPNTINSNFYILIPSTDAVQQKFKEDPWFLKSNAEDEKRAGVDLLIDNDSDIVLTPLGEILLSYGVNNASQAVKILMSTIKGSLTKYQDYGVPALIGTRNQEPELIKQQLSEDIANQILNDNRFERLDSLSVEYIGNQDAASAYRITMSVVLSGGSVVIPISFSVNIS